MLPYLQWFRLQSIGLTSSIACAVCPFVKLISTTFQATLLGSNLAFTWDNVIRERGVGRASDPWPSLFPKFVMNCFVCCVEVHLEDNRKIIYNCWVIWQCLIESKSPSKLNFTCLESSCLVACIMSKPVIWWCHLLLSSCLSEIYTV